MNVQIAAGDYVGAGERGRPPPPYRKQYERDRVSSVFREPPIALLAGRGLAPSRYSPR